MTTNNEHCDDNIDVLCISTVFHALSSLKHVTGRRFAKKLTFHIFVTTTELKEVRVLPEKFHVSKKQITDIVSNKEKMYKKMEMTGVNHRKIKEMCD